MAQLYIKGGNKLSGTITPSGNKNAALPIICATLLTDDNVTLHNIPNLTDINKLVETLTSIGSKIEWDKVSKTILINNSKIDKSLFKNQFPIGMRGSLLLFPGLLNRMKRLDVKSNIGGCSLGIRELDTHFEAFGALGTKVETDPDILMEIKDRFVGGSIWADYMSVTTTENFIMAAALAKGKSVMENAASEPHVQDLCNFLVKMGAKITGIGTSRIEIEGVKELKGIEYTVQNDHHEITTFLALGAITRGEVRVTNSMPEFFPLINKSFAKLGVNIEYEGDTAIVKADQHLKVKEPYTSNMLTKIEISPWPYFPVDLLPLMVAIATKAEGNIMFWNKMYESGFTWVPELMSFGAHVVTCDPHRIIVFGNKPMKPASIDAPDIIRATIALAMVALSIEGVSTVNKADPIKRAHPDFAENLIKLGADVAWEE